MAEKQVVDRPEAHLLDSYYEEDGALYRVRKQLDRELILAQNRAVAADPTNLRAGDGMRWALQIPEDDYAMLVKANPELGSHDREIHHKAWQKFMKTAEARKYMVRLPSKRGMSL